ncbi:glycosyltransferase family 39 protein [Streptomyces somaliensis]|nr:glycosyltransferase family 39 protein [Streptomyces somaliensis]
MALRADGDDPSLGTMLTGTYDAVFYTHIAEHGYAAPMAGSCTVQGPLCKYAFFPLYPALIRGGSTLLPLPAAQVAWGVAVIAALLAAWGVYAVVERVADRRTAVVATVLWGIAPHAMVESMAYTEPVFTALCAWSLYAALDRRWVTAGVLASLAGLTRPSGSAVVAAVVLAALWALFASRRRSASGEDRERPDRTGPLLTAVAVAPLGWFAWFGWVGHRAGDWRGYFEVQERWGSTFDGGLLHPAPRRGRLPEAAAQPQHRGRRRHRRDRRGGVRRLRAAAPARRPAGVHRSAAAHRRGRSRVLPLQGALPAARLPPARTGRAGPRRGPADHHVHAARHGRRPVHRLRRVPDARLAALPLTRRTPGAGAVRVCSGVEYFRRPPKETAE